MKEMTQEKVTQEPVVSDLIPVRTYKDRLFRMIFSDRKEALGLYNAVNNTTYSDSNMLEIKTLDNAIYMNMRNDVSFIIDFQISLYEHQSTYNPNMPLRNLFYICKQYSQLTSKDNLYAESLIKIPTPQFVVFYNGTDPQPERQILRLSDAFRVKKEEVNLELTTLMLNINEGYNQELMNNCKTLHDYMCYVDKVRTYSKKMDLEDAVEMAITECIQNDMLADFLRNNRAEAKSVSIFEYDEELHMRQVKKEGHDEGFAKGISSGELLKLISLARKKLARNLPVEDIADVLEETTEVIAPIVELIKQYPEEDDEMILKRLS